MSKVTHTRLEKMEEELFHYDPKGHILLKNGVNYPSPTEHHPQGRKEEVREERG